MSVITTEFLFVFGCVERSTAASGCSGRLAIDLALRRLDGPDACLRVIAGEDEDDLEASATRLFFCAGRDVLPRGTASAEEGSTSSSWAYLAVSTYFWVNLSWRHNSMIHLLRGPLRLTTPCCCLYVPPIISTCLFSNELLSFCRCRDDVLADLRTVVLLIITLFAPAEDGLAVTTVSPSFAALCFFFERIFRDSKLVGSLSKYVSVCSNQLDPPVAGAYNRCCGANKSSAFNRHI